MKALDRFNENDLCVCGHKFHMHHRYIFADRLGACTVHGCHPTAMGGNDKRCAVFRPKKPKKKVNEGENHG